MKRLKRDSATPAAMELRSRAIEELDDSEIEALARADVSIRRGLADAAAGRTKPAEEVFDRLEAKYRALAREVERDGRT